MGLQRQLFAVQADEPAPRLLPEAVEAEPVGRLSDPAVVAHLEDHGQQVYGEPFQVHCSPAVERLLQLLAGFLTGCFPEYSFSRGAFKAENSEDILWGQR